MPGIGLVLMLLGSRLLRREAQWFRCCFLLTGMQLAYCVFQLILQATPYQAAYAASTVGLVLPYLNALLQLAQGFCLWRGLLAVQLLDLGFPDYVLPAPAAGGDRGLSWGHTGGEQRSGVRPGGRLLPKQRLQPAVHNRGRGKLTGEPAGWMIFRHFLWNTAQPFHGTAAIQLWPVYQSDELWSAAGEVAGRVLYDRGGETFWAPYHSLEEDTSPYGYQGIYGQRDIFGTFSLSTAA